MAASLPLWSWFERVLVDQLHAWLDGNQWLPLWLTGLGTLALAGGVIFAAVGLFDSRKTRDGQLLTELSARWESEEMVESRRAYSDFGSQGIVDLVTRLYSGKTNPGQRKTDLDNYFLLSRWPTFIEGLGVLRDHGSISTEIVYKAWGAGICTAWKAWEDPVRKLRELEGFPETYRHFESLAATIRREVKKREKRDV